MKYFALLRLCGVLFFCLALNIIPVIAQNSTKMSSRILLIPLDDRPPCLQFPVRMGLIGDAEIVTPPKELIGKFTTPGDSDKIIGWLKTQNLKSFDAAIVSIDMLAYGGLVAMRVHQTDDATATRRIEFIRQMRKLAPKMKIYGSSVIMRIAPTGDVKNESYREKLARWAEISVEADAKSRSETATLEQEIPTFALADYKAARIRDLKINLKTIDFVREGTIDYLILSQDDAKPKGIHVADREKLIAATSRLNLSEKIAIQPGADEVSMLLLARSLTDKYNYHPRVKAIYSSEAARDKVMPYEDRALNQTVSFHINAVGGVETLNEKDADILFYVFASRFEAGRAESFSDEIARRIAQNNKIIVADIDPKGDVQGAQDVFVKELLRHRVFSLISGFAAWNTAGNTIGTTLPQSVIANIDFPQKNKNRAERILKSQAWFSMHRLIDDYAYHSVVRPKALQMIRKNNWNAFRLSDEQTKLIEEFCLTELKLIASEIITGFNADNKKICSISQFSFDLPWNRTFEAEIDFQITCRK